MKTTKKALILALAGVMAAALTLTGCFGVGGGNGGNGGNGGGGSSTKSELVGTWKLDYAHDYNGNEYDIASIGADSVVLVVTSETKATFYYFDDDPFEGTLSRDSSQDSHYSADEFSAKCYDLTGADGSYWEFAFITPSDGTPFFYLEVGPSGDYDSLYLAKA